MYNVSDYLKFGSDLVSTHVLHRPRLSVLMFYATSRCNSRCNTCNIWRKTPKEDLSFEVLRRTVESRAVDKKTRIGLEGGEMLLHPDFDNILDYLSSGGYNYELLSNGLLPERLEEAVRRHKIPRVYLSLDGGRETYEAVRGVDGYDKVVASIHRLKEIVPISIMYLINPWNGQADLEHVMGLCREHGLDLRVGVYNNMEFFDTTRRMHEVDYSVDTHVDVSGFAENQAFIDLFDAWKAGEVQLPCLSIRQELVVYPNGDVPLCQNKQIILGNLNERSLDEILADPETVRLQKAHLHCNGCWINFHRKFEVALFGRLRWIPGPLFKPFFGEIKLPRVQPASHGKKVRG